MNLSVAARQQVGQAFVAAVVTALVDLPDTAPFAALETALEEAVRQAGAAALATVVAAQGTGYAGPSRPCPCGGTQTTDHYATCTRQTVLGPVAVRRAAYRCPDCAAQVCPLDADLDLPSTRLSPALQARLSLLCAVAPFAEAAGLLEALTGLRVSAKQAQLTSEALGARVAATPPAPAPPPPTPPERVYLGVDGALYCTVERDAAGAVQWREAKVGVWYTPRPPGAPGTGRPSALAPDGASVDVAEPASQSYVVQMGPWTACAAAVWAEAERRGLTGAREIIVLSDGAVWIQSLVAEVLAGLPGQVTHILDIWHAEEHLWAVARACGGERALAWIQEPLADLREGRVDALVAAVRALPAPDAAAAQLRETTARYYAERAAQMAYPAFRARGLQIGSGLAESACKRLVGQRAKGPGMHWTVAGAQAIGTLRAYYLSGRWPEVEAVARAA